MAEQDYDYIIVGAGSAGCVLANRLSADKDVRVALLEAGARDNYLWMHVPVGYLYCIGNPRTDWCYRTAEEPGLNGRSLLYSRGKGLGGCSAINGMIYMRGQARDYDIWAQLGCRGWAWEDVLPYFLKSEDHFDGASEHHGEGGEWRVEEQRVSWELLDCFAEACTEIGIPRTDDFNRGDNFGVGYFQVNQQAGWRWSTAKGFLRPVQNRENLTVRTGAQVQQVLFEGRRATGVKLTDGDSLTARREVILSAGAIGSPQLLMLSGVGPGEHLRDHGIEVRHAVEEVGRNLQDHLQLRCAYRIDDSADTLNQRALSIDGRAAMIFEYARHRTGPLSMAPSQLGAFTRSHPDVETPDLEYHVQPLTLKAFGEPLDEFPGMTASVCHLRPESRGFVELVSPRPQDAPKIAPNYLSTEGDRMTAARAIRQVRQIMAAPSMARWSPKEIRPAGNPQSDAELVRAAGDIGTTIFHPVGTARMGPDAASVVDLECRVRGLDGLRVVDASVMPRIPSGNTNAPVIMIAEKAADMIRAGARIPA
jgi:choline dehydrogenase